ncbi:MAG: RNA-binding domain-containing protein [Candidatus Njordarchaeum guaymaensis]
MISKKVNYVKISAHVHATEDEDKVLNAIYNLLPKKLIKYSKIREIFRGHFGDPIIRLEIKIENREDAQRIFEHIIRNISGFIYDEWFYERFDEKSQSFFARLDKQSAYLGKVSPGWGDDIIHIVFKFASFPRISKEDFKELIDVIREKRASE